MKTLPRPDASISPLTTRQAAWPLPEVDVLVLSRPGWPPAMSVLKAIEQQQQVRVFVHQGLGRRWPRDANRWETIARGRNSLKQQGTAKWAMFVDDDVVLDKQCVRILVDELEQNPILGAVAADYAADQAQGHWNGHVAMGACLFRREVLQQIEFRCTAHACECQCCCDDLRRRGIEIAYSTRARATHIAQPARDEAPQRRHDAPSPRPGVVLAAFDRRDYQTFKQDFLRSLRTWGNQETVIAVAYGLYPSELRQLSSLPGVSVVSHPHNGSMVPVRRLTDFAMITSRLSAMTPVAYWDVGDVIFQCPLVELWKQIALHPAQIHAVAEPKGYPHNAVIPAWSLSIHDSHFRRLIFGLLQRNPFLNSGFAAGTAAVMHQYFSTAAGYRGGRELSGTSDWGDQMCLNYYCHSEPSRWRAIDEGWNYCVHDRPPGEVTVTDQSLVFSRSRGRIPVVHGNARSLRQFAI